MKGQSDDIRFRHVEGLFSMLKTYAHFEKVKLHLMMSMRLESIQDIALQKGVLFYYIHLKYTFTKIDFYFNCKYQ